MSSLHAPPQPAVDSVIRSPGPAPPVPETDLTTFVLRHAARLADEPAVIDGAGGRALSYGALVLGRRTCVFRARPRRGFGRGDVLALHLPNLPEFALALHAGLRAGGIVTLASPLFTVRELADQLRRARARVLVTAGPLAETATAAAAQAGVEEVLVLGEAPGLTPFAALMTGDGTAPAERADPGDIALMLPSSGTTGLPKLVELTHRSLVANGAQTAIPFPIAEGERVLGLAPFFHSMGLGCVLHHALPAAGP